MCRTIHFEILNHAACHTRQKWAKPPPTTILVIVVPSPTATAKVSSQSTNQRTSSCKAKMGRKNTKGSQQKKKKKQQFSTKKSFQSNFVAEAGPGCYIARRDLSPSWLIEWENIDPEEFNGEEVPDVAIDTEEHTLSLCNVDACTKIAYISVFEARIYGVNGEELSLGSSTTNEGKTSRCATFIVLCPPRVFVHLCFLDPGKNKEITDLEIVSDVQEWETHPNPKDEHPQRLGFPLQGGPFLCTQGEDGELTHFFSGNLHAIDFRCPVGTPLLAVAAGFVVEAKDENTLTGIAVTNLFQWNSIIIRLDEGKHSGHNGPLFVEYVHIQKTHVKLGDRVERGQIIGHSGSVGFSPEPHLHFSAFRSAEPTAPTVRVRFESPRDGAGSTEFLPKAGSWYDSTGMVSAPQS